MEILPVLRTAIDFLTGYFNAIVEAIKPHLHSVIALGSLSFAIWKWYRYRDVALLRRFRDLVNRTVSGLRNGRADLAAIISRPALGQVPTVPLFIEEPLRRVFLKRRWGLILRKEDPTTATDRDLDRALARINQQVEWCDMRQAVFQEQRATVHVLKGAIASARSGKAKNPQARWRLDNEALSHFRNALRVTGNDKDVQAIEYKAHQLKKLGQLEAALEAYCELEDCATEIASPKNRDLTIARAKRYQAEIYTRIAPPAPGRANDLLRSAVLDNLEPHVPLADYDLLDQAQTHELHGCVRFALTFDIVARESLMDAQASYQRLADELDPKNFSRVKRLWQWLGALFHDDGTEALRVAALAGLARVDRALQSGECEC